MSSSEKLPLLNEENPSSNTSDSDNAAAIRELQFPPYYEDGHVRYYAVKAWETIVWPASLYFAYHYDNSEQFYKPYINSSTLLLMILIFKGIFVNTPLALVLAAIVSGRPRTFCGIFYLFYYRICPKSINDRLAKFILGKT